MAARGSIIRAGSWTFIDKLGEGGGGQVFLGRRVDVKGRVQKAAIKVVLLNEKNDRMAKLLEHEHGLLKKLDSPYIAKTFDDGREFSGTKTYYWFAVEQIKGDDLSEEIENDGPLSRIEWLDLAHDLFSALKTAHTAGIIHKDIKPQNIIRNSRKAILLDFGFGSYLNIADPGDVASISLGWTAPEQMDYTVNPQKYTPQLDLFQAAGVLVYAATGKAPWPIPKWLIEAHDLGAREWMAACKRYADEALRSMKPNFHGMEPDLVELISPLLNPRPEKRGTADEVLAKLLELMPVGAARKSVPVEVPTVAEAKAVPKPKPKPKAAPASTSKPKTTSTSSKAKTPAKKPRGKFFKGCMGIFITMFALTTIGGIISAIEKGAAPKNFPETMPSLTGMVLADAIDTMGDLHPNYTDASGLDESIDDNSQWQVCTQNISAGTKLTSTSEPELTVIGISDSCPNVPSFMPNVTGLHLNEADQEIGDLVSNTKWVDATGEGRNWWDETNWQVCSQTPAPGAKVRATTNVVLNIVQLDQTCPVG